MKNSRVKVLSVVVVAVVAFAVLVGTLSTTRATTIGTNISTGGNISADGTLTIGGNTALGNAVTDTLTIQGATTLTQLANASGSPTALTLTGGAHTALTASTEASDVVFNLNRTVQFATGNISNQGAVKILAPTYSFVGASSITGGAATLYINDAPQKGTNATMNNAYALWVDDGDVRLDGALKLRDSEALGITQSASVEEDGIPIGISFVGGAHTNLNATSSVQDVNFNFGRIKTWNTGAITSQSDFIVSPATYAFEGASTVSTANTLFIGGAPLEGSNATITSANVMEVGDPAWTTNATNAHTITFTMPNIASGVGATTRLAGLYLNGNGNLGNQTATLTDLAGIYLKQLTYTSTTNTRTVTNPSTMYIQGAPVAGSNVSFTNGPHALHVDAGLTELGGIVVYTPGDTQTVANDATISCATNTFVQVGGSGGAVILDTNPAIANGTVTGQICTIKGTDNVNTVQIADNVNTSLASDTAVTLGYRDVITLMWDSSSTWLEISRSNN